MEYSVFKIELNKALKELDIQLDEEKSKKLYNYMNLLIEKNKVMNLTGITEPKEIIIKHFVDSLTIYKYIEKNKKIIDIGTGAGFPGIPLKVANETLELTLLDSLNKRILFLNEIIEKNTLEKVETIHGRAEDYGKDIKYREKYDIAVSRAVAPLSILLEYMLPFVKIGGKCICMKGSNCEKEIEESKKAIEILGGKIEKIDKFELTKNDNKRTIIIIKKTKKTPNIFPRNAGIPSKKPL